MNRHPMLKVRLLLGGAMLLFGERNYAVADKFPTGGDFDPSPKTTPFVQELRRIPIKASLPGGAKDLCLAGNGGFEPNGTVYPQITGNDALTTYRDSLEPIVASQQRNSGSNIQFPPKRFYILKVRQAKHVFHPDAPYDKGSIIWGYDGAFPGPTFMSRYGEPILVRVINELFDDPAANPHKINVKEDPGTRFGDARITTHLHNAHTAPESDGNPFDIYPPLDPVFPRPQYPASIRGIRFRDHHYALFRAGLDPTRSADMCAPNVNDGDCAETLSTLWYHDHSDHFTAANVYKGLVGFHLFFDDVDSNDENDSSGKALRLPSGAFDVPLLFQDKRFNAKGQLVLDAETDNNQGFLGDKFTVNGRIQPKLTVLRRKYRFRLLNAGPSRFYQFFLSTKNGVDQTFTQIGNDESLLESALDVKSVPLAVAERADIVVDFSQFKQGDQLFLANRLKMRDDGMGPDFGDDIDQVPLVPANEADQILRFDVGGDAPDPSQVPTKLRAKPSLPSDLPKPLTPQALKALPNHREFEFRYDNQVWTINGQPFDPDFVGERPRQGPPGGGLTAPDGYFWTLRNQDSSNWSHPVHIHLEEFRILLRNGKAPSAAEQNKKDVLIIRPNEEVQIYLRFRDFLGKYPIHCHNVVHEDMMMMMRFDIVR